MRGTVLYGSKDVRFEDVPEPKIEKPTDAIIRLGPVKSDVVCLLARQRTPAIRQTGSRARRTAPDTRVVGLTAL
jgi:hypothetical protein